MNNSNFNSNFIDFFNRIVNDPKNQPNQPNQPNHSHTAEELIETLDYLYKEYQDCLTSVKEEGYKVLRSENGKHRLEKRRK